MRTPVFKVTNDDDPMDYEFPIGVTLSGLADCFDHKADDYAPARALRVGESFTVGGGAAVQFTITRIR